MVDSIKGKQDFADDLAAFFGEAPARKLTDDLFALIAQELPSSSEPTLSPQASHDSIPPLESVSPVSDHSVFYSIPNELSQYATSSPVVAQSSPASVASVLLLQKPSSSRTVKLSSASALSTSSVSPNSRHNTNNSQPRQHEASQPQQHKSSVHQLTSNNGTKKISLKRTREESSVDQPSRKSITLKRGPAVTMSSDKPRFNIRKRAQGELHQSDESQEPQYHPDNIDSPPATSFNTSQSLSSPDDMDVMADESTGPDYVPVITDVNAPFQPEQAHSHSQSQTPKLPNARKHRLNISNEPGMTPSADETSTTRCLFFPSCSKGDACPFFHPPPCTFFPKCRNGDKCPNYHPPCKFSSSCTNALCTYSHPKNRVNPSGSVSSAGAGATPCRFGNQCTRDDCRYSHPRDTKQSNKQSKGPRSSLCAFDPNCTSIGCTFQHPQRDAADEAWMSG